MSIIRVENLGKKYIIGHQKKFGGATFRDAMTHAARGVWQKFRHPLSPNKETVDQEEIWALKDVNFEVKEGERIGIIGRNGAGKSTLLKVLSRITEPTTGMVRLRGRVSSLLEVGTGFHPELTGRENIFLNGAILGMSRVEIKKKFDEIVAFAEVEKFLDTPVKRYSSGMYVRLAFAVAAHLEPEILIVDEVLSVGDAAFQKKCLGKMEDVTKEGRTVLFVSHNMGAIIKLCDRSILFDHGEIEFDNLSNETIRRYQSKFFTGSAEWKRSNHEKNGVFSFLEVTVTDNNDRPKGIFNGNEPIKCVISYEVSRSLAGCQVGITVNNSEGLAVFSTADSDRYGVSALPKDRGRYRAYFTIPSNFLAPGTYFVFIAATLPYRNTYEKIEQTVAFEVSSSGSLAALDKRKGIITPLIDWETCMKKY